MYESSFIVMNLILINWQTLEALLLEDNASWSWSSPYFSQPMNNSWVFASILFTVH